MIKENQLKFMPLLNYISKKYSILHLGVDSDKLMCFLIYNNLKPDLYLGVNNDRKLIEQLNSERLRYDPDISYLHRDYKIRFTFGQKFNIIVCYDLIDNIKKKYYHNLFNNIYINSNEKTIIFLSTSIKHNIIKDELYKKFKIVCNFGLNIKKINLDNLNSAENITYQKLNQFFDYIFLNKIFSVLLPEYAEQNLYILQIKKGVKE